MTRFEKLQAQAFNSTSYRGHTLGIWWKQLEKDSQSRTCRTCGMEVVINRAPAPNQINIGGEAVALTCRR